MQLKNILKKVRKGLFDEVGSDTQRGWSDFELVGYANDAVREIIAELLCLTADDEFTETLATGTLTLVSGTAGEISSVSVNGLVVTSSAVPFNATLNQTATDLAANITAFAADVANTNPIKFTAQANGTVVTISAPSGTGSTPNGYVVTGVATGDLSVGYVYMSGGSCLCKIFVIPGQTVYKLHAKTYLITRFKTGNRFDPLEPRTKQQMDAQYPGWETSENGLPFHYIPDYKAKKITLWPPAAEADSVVLDLVRFPYADLDSEDQDAEPEIPEEYQDAMIPWMKRQAFQKNDVETIDMARSTKFEAEFYRVVEQKKARMQNFQEPRQSGFAPYGCY